MEVSPRTLVFVCVCHKARSTPATMSKQRSTLLPKTATLSKQQATKLPFASTMLLRHCC